MCALLISITVTLNLPLTQCNNPTKKRELEQLKLAKPSEVIYSTVTKLTSPPLPPPPPPVTTVFIPPERDELKEQANNVLSTLLLKAQLKETVAKIEKAQPIERRSVSPPLPPPPTEAEVMQVTFPVASHVVELPMNGNGNKSPVMEDSVVVRMRNNTPKQKSQSATDRRSYVERPLVAMKEKAVEKEDQFKEEITNCGRKAQTIANELMDGKHPVCCVCDVKITR